MCASFSASYTVCRICQLSVRSAASYTVCPPLWRGRKRELGKFTSHVPIALRVTIHTLPSQSQEQLAQGSSWKWCCDNAHVGMKEMFRFMYNRNELSKWQNVICTLVDLWETIQVQERNHYLENDQYFWLCSRSSSTFSSHCLRLITKARFWANATGADHIRKFSPLNGFNYHQLVYTHV